MNAQIEQQLVRLSAEALVLRQRVATLQRENKQLRTALGSRTTIADTATLIISGTRRTKKGTSDDIQG